MTSLEIDDSEVVPGLEIRGGGFSVDVEVLVEGVLVEASLPRSVVDQSTLLIALAPPHGKPLVLRNPGGAQSAPTVVP